MTRATTIPLFWTYLVAALNTGAPGGGTGALSLLVLDDYHVIDARDVQDGMGFLLDHLPRRYAW